VQISQEKDEAEGGRLLKDFHVLLYLINHCSAVTDVDLKEKTALSCES